MENKNVKICLISSSGGHYEQLKKLKVLESRYNLFWVTEKTDYDSNAQYYLKQTGMKDKSFLIKMLWNFKESIRIWKTEKPDMVITTGSMIAIPMAIISKISGKKIIYIETFARVYDGSKTGNLMYKFADLFIVQWKSMKEVYPKAKYGGSIY